jgi:hypothetical protein
MSLDTTGPAESVHTDEYACARAWAALTAAHARVTERLSAALAGTCGLSINEFEVLLRLDRAAPSGMRLGEVSPAVPLTQPSGDPNDRRGVRVTITPAGRETLRRAVPVHARTIRETLLDRLTPAEQDLLAEALARIVED